MSELTRGNVVAFAPRSRSAPAQPVLPPLAAEAARRILDSGYPRYALRERATGAPVPPAVRELKSRIEFVAAALARLPQLPENFKADHFWPA